MKFPAFVDNLALSDDERARARLKYMLTNVAAKICTRGTVKALAIHCGVDNGTLCYGLRKGRLSHRVALALQDGAGKDEAGNYLLRYEDLVFPLRIKSE